MMTDARDPHFLTVTVTDTNTLTIHLSRQAARDLDWNELLENLEVTVVGLGGPPAQRALILHTSKNLDLSIYRAKARMKTHAGLRHQ